MRISFVYKLDDPNWSDGLKKALDVLSEKHDIKYHNGSYTNYFADVVLCWGAFGSWQEQFVSELPYKKAILVAGGPISHPNIHKYDIVFVETKWHQEQFRKLGVNAVVAFGTNTDLFTNMDIQRPIDYLSVGAFAKWKRHELFLEKPGNKVAVGYMQPGGIESECYEMCIENKDTLVIPQVSPEALMWLYNQSKVVSITSTVNGGGERTVLEALSCGCDVEVEPDNPKLVQLLQNKKVPTYLDYAMVLERELNRI